MLVLCLNFQSETANAKVLPYDQNVNYRSFWVNTISGSTADLTSFETSSKSAPLT